jgi:hypothetical protein
MLNSAVVVFRNVEQSGFALELDECAEVCEFFHFTFI